MIIDYPLAPGDTKQPDIRRSLSKIHIPQNLNFRIDPQHGNILPGFCLEVAVKNESIPTLVDTDVARYFAPTTATRYCYREEVMEAVDRLAKEQGVHGDDEGSVEGVVAWRDETARSRGGPGRGAQGIIRREAARPPPGFRDRGLGHGSRQDREQEEV